MSCMTHPEFLPLVERSARSAGVGQGVGGRAGRELVSCPSPFVRRAPTAADKLPPYSHGTAADLCRRGDTDPGRARSRQTVALQYGR